MIRSPIDYKAHKKYMQAHINGSMLPINLEVHFCRSNHDGTEVASSKFMYWKYRKPYRTISVELRVETEETWMSRMSHECVEFFTNIRRYRVQIPETTHLLPPISSIFFSNHLQRDDLHCLGLASWPKKKARQWIMTSHPTSWFVRKLDPHSLMALQVRKRFFQSPYCLLDHKKNLPLISSFGIGGSIGAIS